MSEGSLVGSSKGRGSVFKRWKNCRGGEGGILLLNNLSLISIEIDISVWIKTILSLFRSRNICSKIKCYWCQNEELTLMKRGSGSIDIIMHEHMCVSCDDDNSLSCWGSRRNVRSFSVDLLSKWEPDLSREKHLVTSWEDFSCFPTHAPHSDHGCQVSSSRKEQEVRLKWSR